MFIDTHCHLTDPRFDRDREEALDRALANGVTKVIEVGCTPAEWDQTLALAQTNEHVRCALGIHPHEAKEASPELYARLEALARSAPVVAIGETGIDFHYDHSPRDVQKEVLLRHLDLALALHKPVVIHCREAYQDLISLLTLDGGKYASLRGVIHCFSGTVKEAEKLVELGFVLGIDGPVTYPGARSLRDVVAAIPLDKLLLETDSPYLAPQPHRGQRNEPSYLPLIAEEIARIKRIPVDEVARKTTENAQRTFPLLG